MGGGGEGERGSMEAEMSERLREERGRSAALARFMAARVTEPELLREPGERWMR